MEAFCGFVAGATATLCLHPLDVLKTRLQVAETAKPNYLKLYRGISPNLVGNSLSWALYFFWYDLAKNNLFKDSQLTSIHYLACSALAGACTATCTNPIWVVKTRMFTQNPHDPDAYRGLLDGLSKLWKNEGFAGLYRGYIPALIGVSHGAIQFMTYEYLKGFNRNSQRVKNEKPGMLEYITFACISKTVATVTCYPYQVVKSRIQVEQKYVVQKYSGVISTVSTIFRNEGIHGFYKGLGVNVIRVLPGTMITFGVYEYLTGILKPIHNQII